MSWLVAVLNVVALAWYAAFWAVGLLGWSSARRIYTRRPRSPLASLLPSEVPGVSIIRPLKGLDPNLYENLESSFLQDYPNYEILFSIKDGIDQARQVAEDLVNKYPDVQARVIVGEEVVGVNPKVNNLVKPFREARHDIIWVLDSNVHSQSGTLARSVDALVRPSSPSNSRVGIVHHVPFAPTPSPSSTSSLGSHIEQAFLNTNHAKMYIAINVLALESCVMGKSNMYRKSDVACLTALPSSRGQWKHAALMPDGERVLPTYPPHVKTGLAAFGEFLAEDNMLAASLMHELGLSHSLSCDVAVNALGSMSFPDYIQRRARWIRVRKHMVLSATLLEPLTECFAIGVLATFALYSLFGLSTLALVLFGALHLGLWLAVDLDVYTSLAGHPVPAGEWWAFVGSWVLRETLAFPIWLYAVCGSDVIWRGEPYRVLGSGKVKKIERKTRGTKAATGNSPRRRGNYQLLDQETVA